MTGPGELELSLKLPCACSAAKPDARLTLNLAVTEFAFVWDFVGEYTVLAPSGMLLWTLDYWIALLGRGACC